MDSLEIAQVAQLLRAFSTYRQLSTDKINDLVRRCWVGTWSVVGEKVLAPPAAAREKRRAGMRLHDFGAFTVAEKRAKGGGGGVQFVCDAAFLARLGAKQRAGPSKSVTRAHQVLRKMPWLEISRACGCEKGAARLVFTMVLRVFVDAARSAASTPGGPPAVCKIGPLGELRCKRGGFLRYVPAGRARAGGAAAPPASAAAAGPTPAQQRNRAAAQRALSDAESWVDALRRAYATVALFQSLADEGLVHARAVAAAFGVTAAMVSSFFARASRRAAPRLELNGAAPPRALLTLEQWVRAIVAADDDDAAASGGSALAAAVRALVDAALADAASAGADAAEADAAVAQGLARRAHGAARAGGAARWSAAAERTRALPLRAVPAAELRQCLALLVPSMPRSCAQRVVQHCADGIADAIDQSRGVVKRHASPLKNPILRADPRRLWAGPAPRAHALGTAAAAPRCALRELLSPHLRAVALARRLEALMSARASAGSGADGRAALLAIFDRCDRLGSGRITQMQLRRALDSVCGDSGLDATPEELAVLVAEFDRDGDGTVDAAEFIEAFASGGSGGGSISRTLPIAATTAATATAATPATATTATTANAAAAAMDSAPSGAAAMPRSRDAPITRALARSVNFSAAASSSPPATTPHPGSPSAPAPAGWIRNARCRLRRWLWQSCRAGAPHERTLCAAALRVGYERLRAAGAESGGAAAAHLPAALDAPLVRAAFSTLRLSTDGRPIAVLASADDAAVWLHSVTRGDSSSSGNGVDALRLADVRRLVESAAADGDDGAYIGEARNAANGFLRLRDALFERRLTVERGLQRLSGAQHGAPCAAVSAESWSTNVSALAPTLGAVHIDAMARCLAVRAPGARALNGAPRLSLDRLRVHLGASGSPALLTAPTAQEASAAVIAEATRRIAAQLAQTTLRDFVAAVHAQRSGDEAARGGVRGVAAAEDDLQYVGIGALRRWLRASGSAIEMETLQLGLVRWAAAARRGAPPRGGISIEQLLRLVDGASAVDDAAAGRDPTDPNIAAARARKLRCARRRVEICAHARGDALDDEFFDSFSTASSARGAASTQALMSRSQFTRVLIAAGVPLRRECRAALGPFDEATLQQAVWSNDTAEEALAPAAVATSASSLALAPHDVLELFHGEGADTRATGFLTREMFARACALPDGPWAHLLFTRGRRTSRTTAPLPALLHGEPDGDTRAAAKSLLRALLEWSDEHGVAPALLHAALDADSDGFVTVDDIVGVAKTASGARGTQAQGSARGGTRMPGASGGEVERVRRALRNTPLRWAAVRHSRSDAPLRATIGALFQLLAGAAASDAALPARDAALAEAALRCGKMSAQRWAAAVRSDGGDADEAFEWLVTNVCAGAAAAHARAPPTVASTAPAATHQRPPVEALSRALFAELHVAARASRTSQGVLCPSSLASFGASAHPPSAAAGGINGSGAGLTAADVVRVCRDEALSSLDLAMAFDAVVAAHAAGAARSTRARGGALLSPPPRVPSSTEIERLARLLGSGDRSGVISAAAFCAALSGVRNATSSAPPPRAAWSIASSSGGGGAPTPANPWVNARGGAFGGRTTPPLWAALVIALRALGRHLPTDMPPTATLEGATLAMQALFRSSCANALGSPAELREWLIRLVAGDEESVAEVTMLLSPTVVTELFARLARTSTDGRVDSVAWALTMAPFERHWAALHHVRCALAAQEAPSRQIFLRLAAVPGARRGGAGGARDGGDAAPRVTRASFFTALAAQISHEQAMVGIAPRRAAGLGALAASESAASSSGSGARARIEAHTAVVDVFGVDATALWRFALLGQPGASGCGTGSTGKGNANAAEATMTFHSFNAVFESPRVRAADIDVVSDALVAVRLGVRGALRRWHTHGSSSGGGAGAGARSGASSLRTFVATYACEEGGTTATFDSFRRMILLLDPLDASAAGDATELVAPALLTYAATRELYRAAQRGHPELGAAASIAHTASASGGGAPAAGGVRSEDADETRTVEIEALVRWLGGPSSAARVWSERVALRHAVVRRILRARYSTVADAFCGMGASRAVEGGRFGGARGASKARVRFVPAAAAGELVLPARKLGSALRELIVSSGRCAPSAAQLGELCESATLAAGVLPPQRAGGAFHVDHPKTSVGIERFSAAFWPGASRRRAKEGGTAAEWAKTRTKTKMGAKRTALAQRSARAQRRVTPAQESERLLQTLMPATLRSIHSHVRIVRAERAP